MSRTDRLIADVERGFAALDEGKLEAAAAVLERCKRIDRQHPDVIALAAGIAEADGNTEEALAQYRALVTLHPDDPVPRICIARLELHDHNDPDAALDAVESAFDFIDEESDLIEAIRVKTAALVLRGEPEEARATLGELATSAIDDGELALELAELALDAEDPAAAARWIEITRKLEPPLEADALHALGRVHEATGDRAAMITAWQEVRRLDAAAPDGDLHVSEDELERIAAAALAELPERVRAKLAHVPVLIESAPSEELVADGIDPRVLGLFSGVPMSEDGGLAPEVTTIQLFQRNLEFAAHDLEHLAAEIRITVLHETAHYFGLDEDDLKALGLD